MPTESKDRDSRSSTTDDPRFPMCLDSLGCPHPTITELKVARARLIRLARIARLALRYQFYGTRPPCQLLTHQFEKFFTKSSISMR
jgi:hypothetical protein